MEIRSEPNSVTVKFVSEKDYRRVISSSFHQMGERGGGIYEYEQKG